MVLSRLVHGDFDLPQRHAWTAASHLLKQLLAAQPQFIGIGCGVNLNEQMSCSYPIDPAVTGKTTWGDLCPCILRLSRPVQSHVEGSDQRPEKIA